MPNWCDNTVLVKGTAGALKRFDEQFKKEHNAFEGGTGYNADKEHIEKEKKNWIAHNIGETNYTFITEIKKEAGYSFTNFIEMTQQDFLNGWYNWSCQHWGTKWDIGEVSESGIDLVDEALKNNELDTEIEVYYSFDTAWSPAEPVVLAMAQQFPELHFEHRYLEEGCQFAGIVTYYDGEETSREESEDDGFREFIQKHFDDERYIRCPYCNELVEEYEIEEEDGNCPECDKHIDVEALRNN